MKNVHEMDEMRTLNRCVQLLNTYLWVFGGGAFTLSLTLTEVLMSSYSVARLKVQWGKLMLRHDNCCSTEVFNMLFVDS